MNQEKNTQSANITEISKSLGLPSLLIIENENKKKLLIADKLKELKAVGFKQAKDYLEVMNALETNEQKIVYAEQTDKLDNLILEIIAEYGTGIISLADRKNNTGLKTVKFNPNEILFVVIMTRSQIEKSYVRLFEYIGTVESI